MKIRIKFTREERVKFLGHLDIMRSFQRGFIRAGVKMTYTEGFNPHQKMNFAQPLGVGVTSCGEYMDAEIADGQNLEDIRKRLDIQMGEGFRILKIRALAETDEKGMAAVKYASYEVTCLNKMPDIEPFRKAANVFAVKKTKSAETEIDIRKLVYKLDCKENKLLMLVSAGSENNLKCDLLLSKLCDLSGITYDRNDYGIKRTDLYGKNFMPLSEL